MEQYLEFAKEIAKEAGKIMIKYFNSDNGSMYKGDNTIVTLADKEINSYVIKRVKEQYPTHSVDGEEEMFGESKYIWVCDPIDGTAMYARHIPVATFSLALVIDGISEVGVIYDVFTDNIYTAIRGKGAFKNNEKIDVNNLDFDGMRTVGHFDAWRESEYNIDKVIDELRKETYLVSIGSVVRACACVASGDFNVVIFPGTKHKNCDIAAAKVIVEEAGGIVTDMFGNEQRYDKDINGAIVSNKVVHSKVLEIIKKYCVNKLESK